MREVLQRGVKPPRPALLRQLILACAEADRKDDALQTYRTMLGSGAVAAEELFAALVRVALTGGEEPDLRLADQLVAQVVHTGRELRGGLLSSVIEAHVAEHNWQRGFELLQEGLKVGPETVGELHAAVLALLRAACEHSAPGGPSIPRPNTAHPSRAP